MRDSAITFRTYLDQIQREISENNEAQRKIVSSLNMTTRTLTDNVIHLSPTPLPEVANPDAELHQENRRTAQIHSFRKDAENELTALDKLERLQMEHAKLERKKIETTAQLYQVQMEKPRLVGRGHVFDFNV